MNNRRKCAVPWCLNHTDEGAFVGEFCSPCYNFLSGQTEGQYSQAYRNNRIIKILEPLILEYGVQQVSLVLEGYTDKGRRRY